MTAVVLMWLAIVAQADAGFTAAQVEGEEATAATMELDVEVRLLRSDGPVVAHLRLPGEPSRVRPLVRRGDRRWGVLLELRRADWRIVFEDVSTGDLSGEASLTELGLEPALLGAAPRSGREIERGPGWWLRPETLAAAAAFSIMAAAWSTAGRSRPRHLRRRAGGHSHSPGD